jgi:hypothetical protein
MYEEARARMKIALSVLAGGYFSPPDPITGSDVDQVHKARAQKAPPRKARGIT